MPGTAGSSSSSSWCPWAGAPGRSGRTDGVWRGWECWPETRAGAGLVREECWPPPGLALSTGSVSWGRAGFRKQREEETRSSPETFRPKSEVAFVGWP